MTKAMTKGVTKPNGNASPWRTRDTISSDILFSSPAKSRREQIASYDARNKCVKNGRLRVTDEIPCSENCFPCSLSKNSLFQCAGNFIESARILGAFEEY